MCKAKHPSVLAVLRTSKKIIANNLDTKLSYQLLLLGQPQKIVPT